MPAFTLYGSRGSTNTDRVRLTLAEGGFTDYELVLINLQKGEQKVCEAISFENEATYPRVSKVYIADTAVLVQRKPATSPMGQNTHHHFPRWVYSLREPRNLQIPREEVLLPASTLGLRRRSCGAV